MVILQPLYLFRSKAIDNSKSYTVGQINDYSEPISSAPEICYVYKVNKKKYKYKEGKFYRVQYSLEKPERSRIMLDVEIKDTFSIKKAGFALPHKKMISFKITKITIPLYLDAKK